MESPAHGNVSRQQVLNRLEQHESEGVEAPAHGNASHQQVLNWMEQLESEEHKNKYTH